MSSLFVHKGPGLLGGGGFFFDEGPVIAVAYEADFLALLQFVHRKAQGVCFFPDIGLLHLPYGKE